MGLVTMWSFVFGKVDCEYRSLCLSEVAAFLFNTNYKNWTYDIQLPVSHLIPMPLLQLEIGGK